MFGGCMMNHSLARSHQRSRRYPPRTGENEVKKEEFHSFFDGSSTEECGNPEIALDKPPQQCTHCHNGRDEPYHPHASRKSDLVLRRVFLYPGLPNAFVELWIFTGLQHSSFINSFWYILSHNCD